MPSTIFRAVSHGFHFVNNFVNHFIPGMPSIKTEGLCGGMSYAALDYFFNSLPIPPHATADFPFTGGIPAEGSRLNKYLFSRQLDSFATATAPKFLAWTLASDASVQSDTRTKEIPKLRAAIADNKPVVLGLVNPGALSAVASSHQVIAYGFTEHPITHAITVQIYDNNFPDREMTLSVPPLSAPVTESTSPATVWKGFFVQDYTAKMPGFMASTEEVWSDDWSTGWTSFMPFMLGGRQHYLAYKTGVGQASIDRIKTNLHGVDTLFSAAPGQWTRGWSTFMPFTLGGQPHYLGYKVNSGQVTVDRIRRDGSNVDTIQSGAAGTWTNGWTSFVPFTQGDPLYLAYKAGTGEVSIDHILADGQIESIWSDTWTKGWTTLMPFEFNGEPHYLGYKIATGQVTIDRIRPDSQGVDTVFSDQYTKGWTSFVPFNFNGLPHYLCYKVDSGQFSVDRFKANLQGVDVVRGGPAGSWTKGWTSFMSFNSGIRPFYLGYKESTGQMTFGKFIL